MGEPALVRQWRVAGGPERRLAFLQLRALRQRLAGTEWAHAQVSTLQARLLKVAAAIRDG